MAGPFRSSRGKLPLGRVHIRAGVGEYPHALADDHREDEQVHLIDEVVIEQPPAQGAAAMHLQFTRWADRVTGDI